MRRPKLREIPLSDALPLRVGEITITLSRGQWDNVLQTYYSEGCVLLELDDRERPIRAYQAQVGVAPQPDAAQ